MNSPPCSAICPAAQPREVQQRPPIRSRVGLVERRRRRRAGAADSAAEPGEPGADDDDPRRCRAARASASEHARPERQRRAAGDAAAQQLTPGDHRVLLHRRQNRSGGEPEPRGRGDDCRADPSREGRRVPRPARGRPVRDPEPVGRGLGEGARLAGLRGAGDDQLRLRLHPRTPRRRGDARRGGRARARASTRPLRSPSRPTSRTATARRPGTPRRRSRAPPRPGRSGARSRTSTPTRASTPSGRRSSG